MTCAGRTLSVRTRIRIRTWWLSPLLVPQAATIPWPLSRYRFNAARQELSAPHEPELKRIDEVVVTYFAKTPFVHHRRYYLLFRARIAGCAASRRGALRGPGARLAEPGESTMRAFLNGRIDLTQAEAVRDLIESQTLYQGKIAVSSWRAHLPPPAADQQKLVELIALLEAGIDFAEDDVPVIPGIKSL